MPRNRRHYRLSLADALSAHDEALRHGGLEGIHNLGLIESAIARPYSGYYPTISQKAAALVESFARNHGFVDGNKRSTLILLTLLLAKSGYRLTITERHANKVVRELILAVVKREFTFNELIQWFKERLIKA